MKYVFFFILICNSVFAQDWYTYQDPDELFTIAVPDTVSILTKDILTGMDKLQSYTYVIDRSGSEDPNFLYLINVVDYPEGSFPADSTTLIDDFLKEAINSLSMNLKGKIDYTVDLPSSTRGKKTRISQDDKDTVVKAIVYIFEDRFYTLQVFTNSSASLNRDIDRFLDSFKLLR